MPLTSRRFAAPLLAGLLAVLLSVYAQVSSEINWGYGSDSYRYTRASLQILGESPSEAHLHAVTAFCRTEGAPQGPRCLAQNRHSLPPDRPRYERIFAARPGYPLLAAPFIAAFGVLKGLWALSLVLTMASSLLVYHLLRLVGSRRYVAIAGQLLYLGSGLGYAGMRPLVDSPVTFFTFVCALGAIRMLQTRSGAGLAWLLAGFTLLGLSKYSTALALAAGLAVTASAYAYAFRSHTCGRGPVLLAGVSAGVALTLGAVTAAFGLPGLNETVQDLLTNHFTRPDVTDPLGGMLAREVGYWPAWLHTNTAFALLLAATSWTLWRRKPVLAVPAIAAALAGLGSNVVHPISDGDRLWVLAWVPVVLGLPVLLGVARTWSGVALPTSRRPSATPERDHGARHSGAKSLRASEPPQG